MPFQYRGTGRGIDNLTEEQYHAKIRKIASQYAVTVAEQTARFAIFARQNRLLYESDRFTTNTEKTEVLKNTFKSIYGIIVSSEYEANLIKMLTRNEFQNIDMTKLKVADKMENIVARYLIHEKEVLYDTIFALFTQLLGYLNIHAENPVIKSPLKRRSEAPDIFAEGDPVKAGYAYLISAWQAGECGAGVSNLL